MASGLPADAPAWAQQLLATVNRVDTNVTQLTERVTQLTATTSAGLYNAHARVSNSLADFATALMPLQKEVAGVPAGAPVGALPPADMFPPTRRALQKLTGAALDSLQNHYNQLFAGAVLDQRRNAFAAYIGAPAVH